MTDVQINQARQGSSAERRLRDARARFHCPRPCSALSRKFDLSERQAYRYLEEATHLDRPVEVSEATVPMTLKAPDGNSTSSSGVCEKQWADDRCDRDTSVGRVSEYSEKAWLSRAERAAGFKFTLTICLIACTTRSSPRPTVFLCPFGSAPSVAV